MPEYQRTSGILLHVTSLPGNGPVGNMGRNAYRFVDFLAEAGQRVWQILPLTPPARGNSPYSPLSAFAGNPYLICPIMLEDEGLLPAGSCDSWPDSPGESDFDSCDRALTPLLRLCFNHSFAALSHELEEFGDAQGFWLNDYALFLALREKYGSDFRRWPSGLAFREKEALEIERDCLSEEVAYHSFVQYLFFRQWESLRRYASARGVHIFGDVPFYIDIDAVDLWANPELFQLDAKLNPLMAAGVPPDAFSADGQLWGNPLYNWEALRRSDYRWWILRLQAALRMYDMTRIDHFRALSSYWAVPAGAQTAREGAWNPGPGMEFINATRGALPDLRLIAEDLGLIDDNVRALMRESGLPGLSVLQFAFSPDMRSIYLPHSITPDRVAYLGTHDNDTALGWLASLPEHESSLARGYMRLNPDEGEHWGMIKNLLATPAFMAIIQMQDVLGLGSEARMNTPSESEGNWRWRMREIPHDLSGQLAWITSLYGRR